MLRLYGAACTANHISSESEREKPKSFCIDSNRNESNHIMCRLAGIFRNISHSQAKSNHLKSINKYLCTNIQTHSEKENEIVRAYKRAPVCTLFAHNIILRCARKKERKRKKVTCVQLKKFCFPHVKYVCTLHFYYSIFSAFCSLPFLFWATYCCCCCCCGCSHSPHELANIYDCSNCNHIFLFRFISLLLF